MPSWIRSRNGHGGPRVALGDRDDQAQVGLDQLALGRHVAALDALGQGDLLHGRQQRHLADLPEVHAHRVVAGGPCREVEPGDGAFPALFLASGLLALVARGLVAFEDIDAEVVEEDQDVVDLLGVKVDVPQHVAHVFGVQVALLAALDDEVADLFDVQLGHFARPTLIHQFTHCLIPTPGKSGPAPGLNSAVLATL